MDLYKILIKIFVFLKNVIPTRFYNNIIRYFPFPIIDDLSKDICEFLQLNEPEFLKSIQNDNYIKNYSDFQEDYGKWLKTSNYYFYDLCKWHIQEKFDFIMKTYFPFCKLKLKNLKILDFGSGIGTRSLIYAKKNDVTLVEINQKLLDFAKWRFKRFNLKAKFCTDIPSDKKYDLIMLIDVIGHITNPDQIISQLCSSLKKDGILHITFDNFDETSKFDLHRNREIDFHNLLIKNSLVKIGKNYYKKL